MLSQRVRCHAPHVAILAFDSEAEPAEESTAPRAMAVQGHMVHGGVLTQQLTHEAVPQAFALVLRGDEQQPEVGNGPAGGRPLLDDGEAVRAPLHAGAAGGNGSYDIGLNQAANV